MSNATPPTLATLRLTDPTDHATAARLYADHGAFITRDLLPATLFAEIRAEIRALIALACQAAGRPTPTDPTFDAGFTDLCAAVPAASEAIFAACRRLTTVHCLSVHPALLEMSRRLMRTELVMIPPYKPIRIDHTLREAALLPWHQDYPYAQDSPDSVVYWIPLIDVDETNGCLEVAPGTHTDGIRPVIMQVAPPGGPSGKGLRLANPDPPPGTPTLRLPMRADEVLVQSALLLHRSRPNHTDRARWTVQVRHGNFAHPTAVAKGWPRGHYERHWFDETHPEDVVGTESTEEKP